MRCKCQVRLIPCKCQVRLILCKCQVRLILCKRLVRLISKFMKFRETTSKGYWIWSWIRAKVIETILNTISLKICPNFVSCLSISKKQEAIRLEVFSKTAVLKEFSKLKKKTRLMESFIIKIADSSFIILPKIKFHQKCFPENFGKFFWQVILLAYVNGCLSITWSLASTQKRPLSINLPKT